MSEYCVLQDKRVIVNRLCIAIFYEYIMLAHKLASAIQFIKIAIFTCKRYVSDFPDDLLWNHPSAILLPHLGASTEEAEDAAASMAAETIRDFLETGTIRNSVNFPSTSLPNRPENSIRFTVVTKNVPGMLAHISEAFAGSNLNILQQINQSRGNIAYNVVDVDTSGHGVVDFKDVQEKITMLDGVLSSRIIYGVPGTGYAKNLEGDYFV